MKKRNKIGLLMIVLIIGGFFFLSGRDSPTGNSIVIPGENTILYKSGSCGCCSIYASYFEKKLDFVVEVVNTERMDGIKKEFGVPLQLQSCHTTKVGDYFIEGHIPVEAIEKLLLEKPDIKGIAMPGMPSGSPGMPGPKEPFKIYKVNNDGSFEEFITL